MKPIHRFFLAAVIIAALAPTATFSAGQAEAPKAETPVLLTSCGQSPGPVMLKVILQKLGLKYELNALATPADLKAKAQAGTPYKSLVIVMGASLKGMGAAGISIDDELKRSAELIDEGRVRAAVTLSAGDGKTQAYLASRGTIIDRTYRDSKIQLELTIERRFLEKARKLNPQMEVSLRPTGAAWEAAGTPSG